MKTIISSITKIAALTLALQNTTAQDVIPESKEAFDQRMQWFNDSQFGLFIHYGVYSNLAGEWKGEPVERYAEWIQRWGNITPDEYTPLAADFNPEQLDADLWVKTAKEAGMKYMVITTKHHEGVCLWDSAVTEYDIGEATTFDRDILGELKAACDKYGIKFGTYYSIIDWHHPSQRAEKALSQTTNNDKAGYITYMKAQLQELIERYDPAIMWFDGDWVKWWTMEDGIDLYNYLRELSPEMIINNRVAKRAAFKKDYGTPENSTPGASLDHFWEACWTINHSWGYKKSDQKWKSHTELIQKQIDINTKGGNLLLNIGPKSDGSWPEASFGQLKTMGAWNAAHQDAVYSTENANLPIQAWGKLAWSKTSNAESGELFAYIFDWPSDEKLLIKLILADTITASAYEGQPLPTTTQKNGIEIDLSSITPNEYATVVRVKYNGLRKLKSEGPDLKLAGNELILQASDANYQKRKLIKPSDDFIAFSFRPKVEANWALNVPAPSKYQVKMLYSCIGHTKKTKAVITAGSAKIESWLEPTPGLDAYNLLELGIIELDQVGAIQAKLSFQDMARHSHYQIKSIIFVPVSE